VPEAVVAVVHRRNSTSFAVLLVACAASRDYQ
jgi:hypothetical protein